MKAAKDKNVSKWLTQNVQMHFITPENHAIIYITPVDQFGSVG